MQDGILAVMVCQSKNFYFGILEEEIGLLAVLQTVKKILGVQVILNSSNKVLTRECIQIKILPARTIETEDINPTQ